jgi:hypothetical protein
MFNVLIYDAIVAFGFGYGIIGNAIRYYQTSAKCMASLKQVKDVSITTLKGEEKKETSSFYIIPVMLPGPIMIPLPIPYTEHKKKTFVHFRGTDMETCETISRFNVDYDFKKGQPFNIITETLTDPPQDAVVEKFGFTPATFPLKNPVKKQAITCEMGYLGETTFSIEKQRVYRREMFRNRLPLTLTFLTISAVGLGLSWLRYKQTLERNKGSDSIRYYESTLLRPILTPTRYKQLYESSSQNTKLWIGYIDLPFLI